MKPMEYCPACGAPLNRVSLGLMKLFFSPEQKAAGGKQLQCPSCKLPLWLDLEGNVTAASGCGDDRRELLDML